MRSSVFAADWSPEITIVSMSNKNRSQDFFAIDIPKESLAGTRSIGETRTGQLGTD